MDISVKSSTKQLDGIIKRLEPEKRAALNAEIALELEETIREHLTRYARTHHATAQKLNSRPTGNLEEARYAHKSDSAGAIVTVAASGIRRALGPLEIIAKNKQCLTIAAHYISYGRRVAEVERNGWKVFRPRGKNYLATKEEGKDNLTILYFLAKRATLKAAGDMLPSVDIMRRNCILAAQDYISGGKTNAT